MNIFSAMRKQQTSVGIIPTLNEEIDPLVQDKKTIGAIFVQHGTNLEQSVIEFKPIINKYIERKDTKAVFELITLAMTMVQVFSNHATKKEIVTPLYHDTLKLLSQHSEPRQKILESIAESSDKLFVDNIVQSIIDSGDLELMQQTQDLLVRCLEYVSTVKINEFATAIVKNPENFKDLIQNKSIIEALVHRSGISCKTMLLCRIFDCNSINNSLILEDIIALLIEAKLPNEHWEKILKLLLNNQGFEILSKIVQTYSTVSNNFLLNNILFNMALANNFDAKLLKKMLPLLGSNNNLVAALFDSHYIANQIIESHRNGFSSDLLDLFTKLSKLDSEVSTKLVVMFDVLEQTLPTELYQSLCCDIVERYINNIDNLAEIMIVALAKTDYKTIVKNQFFIKVLSQFNTLDESLKHKLLNTALDMALKSNNKLLAMAILEAYNNSSLLNTDFDSKVSLIIQDKTLQVHLELIHNIYKKIIAQYSEPYEFLPEEECKENDLIISNFFLEYKDKLNEDTLELLLECYSDVDEIQQKIKQTIYSKYPNGIQSYHGIMLYEGRLATGEIMLPKNKNTANLEIKQNAVGDCYFLVLTYLLGQLGVSINCDFRNGIGVMKFPESKLRIDSEDDRKHLVEYLSERGYILAFNNEGVITSCLLPSNTIKKIYSDNRRVSANFEIQAMERFAGVLILWRIQQVEQET